MDQYITALCVRSHDTVNVICTAHVAERSWYTQLSQCCHGTTDQWSYRSSWSSPPRSMAPRPHWPRYSLLRPTWGRGYHRPGSYWPGRWRGRRGRRAPRSPTLHPQASWVWLDVVVTDNILSTKHLHASSVHRLRHAAPTVLLTAIRRAGGITLSLRHLPAWPGRTVAVGTLWGKT